MKKFSVFILSFVLAFSFASQPVLAMIPFKKRKIVRLTNELEKKLKISEGSIWNGISDDVIIDALFNFLGASYVVCVMSSLSKSWKDFCEHAFRAKCVSWTIRLVYGKGMNKKIAYSYIKDGIEKNVLTEKTYLDHALRFLKESSINCKVRLVFDSFPRKNTCNNISDNLGPKKIVEIKTGPGCKFPFEDYILGLIEKYAPELEKLSFPGSLVRGSKHQARFFGSDFKKLKVLRIGRRDSGSLSFDIRKFFGKEEINKNLKVLEFNFGGSSGGVIGQKKSVLLKMLKSIGCLKELEELKIGLCTLIGGEEVFKFILSRLEKLEILEINGCRNLKLDEALVDFPKKVKDLTVHRHFKSTNFPDIAEKYLQGLESFSLIKVKDFHFSKEKLISGLLKLKELKELNLINCSVELEKEDLICLVQGLEKLEELSVWTTQTSEENFGLEDLKAIRYDPYLYFSEY